MFNTNIKTGPRQELSMAVVQGEGANEKLVGEILLPDMPLDRRTAHLLVIRAADTQARRIIADSRFLRAPGTRYEKLRFQISDDTLTVQLRGVEADVPYEAHMDTRDYLALENVICGRLGNEIIPLTKEFLRMRALTSTAIFGAAVNSAVPYTKANKANCSFFDDVIDGARLKRQVGEPVDSVLVSGPLNDFLRRSPAVLAFLRANVAAGQMEVNDAAILEALKPYGIKNYLVQDSYYNDGPDGSLSYKQMLPNNYIGLYRAGVVGSRNTETAEALPNTTTPASGGQISTVDGITVPQLSGIGCMTFWQGWAEGGVPLPLNMQNDKDGLQMEGGNFIEIYWKKSTETYTCRAKMSSMPYIGDANAGMLINAQPINATGPLQ